METSTQTPPATAKPPKPPKAAPFPNGLTRDEHETVIVSDMRSAKFTVTTVIPKHLRKFTKLWGPGEVLDKFWTRRWVVTKLPVLHA